MDTASKIIAIATLFIIIYLWNKYIVERINIIKIRGTKTFMKGFYWIGFIIISLGIITGKISNP